jgi:hypothetical protein
MHDFQVLGRIINDKRNWLAVILAGSLVFLGFQLLDYWELDGSIWIIMLIAFASFAAEPLIKR